MFSLCLSSVLLYATACVWWEHRTDLNINITRHDTDLIDLSYSPSVIGLAVTLFCLSLNFPSGPPYAEKRPSKKLAMSPNILSSSILSVSVLRVTESPSITNTVFISPVSTQEKHWGTATQTLFKSIQKDFNAVKSQSVVYKAHLNLSWNLTSTGQKAHFRSNRTFVM